MKDTFYFSHDYNTRTDEKIKLLVRKHGMAGYGIYWAIVEDLYNNANALRTDCDGIAYELRTQSEIIKSILNDFELFVFDGDFFGSLSVQRRLDDRKLKSKKASDSAQKRWGNANAMRTQCDGNAKKERKGKEIKESKVNKEKKEGDKITPPAFNEFKIFALENKKNVNVDDLELKYKAWLTAGWKCGKPERPIKNWKSTLLNTLPFIKENKSNNSNQQFIRIKNDSDY